MHSAERQDLRNAPSTDGLERELRAVNRFGSGASEDVILLLFDIENHLQLNSRLEIHCANIKL